MKRILFTSCVVMLLGFLVITSLCSRQAGAQGPLPDRAEPGVRFVPGRVLVKFRSNIGRDHAQQVIAGLGARDAAEIPNIGVHILDLPYQASEMAFVHAFEKRPEVEFAELDRLLPTEQMTPNDPYYSNPNAWHLQKINAPNAWAINSGSTGIVIAILDTGVDANHPDLAAKIVPGWNVYNRNSDTSDVNGHGTAVAGTAAAATDNGIGVAAVAWGCRIMPVRISDASGMASLSDIASGLTWAADHGARVANISYMASNDSTVSRAARYFQGKGGVVAVAAGNYGSFNDSPDDPNVLTVGASNSLDVLFPWSSYGGNQDLVAPGNVLTTGRGGSYVSAGGTSFASPIVAGAAALILSTNPSLTPAQVQSTLKQSADDLGSPGWDVYYGFGRLNLGRAVSMALSEGGEDTTPPIVSIVSPTEGSMVSGTLSVSVNVTDDTGVTKVQLYVDGFLTGSSTNAPFAIRWNTRKATAGVHTIQSKAYDAVGNVGVSSTVALYK